MIDGGIDVEALYERAGPRGRGRAGSPSRATRPRAGRQSEPRPPVSLVALADAYRLDDAPAFEAFHFVTADEPFAMDDLLAAVQRSAARRRLPLPARPQPYSVVLRKGNAG